MGTAAGNGKFSKLFLTDLLVTIDLGYHLTIEANGEAIISRDPELISTRLQIQGTREANNGIRAIDRIVRQATEIRFIRIAP